ncbi:acyl-CoA thioesterase [Rhodococcus wratislaviensis]|uniref:Acyl-CoA thioesterase n=1 Tax=Rhodococcus wratislaviensis TaxID=44752 RepID=A0AB38F6S1_RHOWR|nr:thioesterase family protein [Rhodococcus wratislaviensis]REE70720.1 acyl-CoA thioesterase [Rhodococcus wratislaviensis]SPZ34920.1 Uncharacterised protein [Rhodococcus wratislaviensis]
MPGSFTRTQTNTVDAAPASSFLEATAVESIGPGRFAAQVDPAWSARGKPNGGLLLSIAARAVMAVTGRPHPYAVSGSFVRAPDEGPVEIRVEVLKAGRQVAQVRASLWQRGAVVLDTLIVVGDTPDSTPAWREIPDPVPAPYAMCVPLARQPGRTGLVERVDIRYDPAAAPTRGNPVPRRTGMGDAHLRGWVEFSDGSAPDVLAALLMADVLPPSVHNLGLPGWAPTVQMSTYLRAVPAPGPLAVSVSGRLLSGRWFDEVADVYDVDGTLVAQTRQIALVAGRAPAHSRGTESL